MPEKSRDRYIKFVPGDHPTPNAEEMIRGDVYLGVFVDTAIPERTYQMATVAAPVAPASGSTINWANIVAPFISVLAWVGLDVDADTLVKLIIGIQGTVSIFTIVKNTWFSPNVMAPSALELPKVTKK